MSSVSLRNLGQEEVSQQAFRGKVLQSGCRLNRSSPVNLHGFQEAADACNTPAMKQGKANPGRLPRYERAKFNRCAIDLGACA